MSNEKEVKEEVKVDPQTKPLTAENLPTIVKTAVEGMINSEEFRDALTERVTDAVLETMEQVAEDNRTHEIQVTEKGSAKSGFIEDPLYRESYRSCNDPDHTPPRFISVPKGKIYRHVCPSCGSVTFLRNKDIELDDIPDLFNRIPRFFIR